MFQDHWRCKLSVYSQGNVSRVQTMSSLQLYSIGHSNVATEQLLALLRQHAIHHLCDVRSSPYSRYNPQFNRENLAESVRQAGLVYHFLGDALGGKPTDPALRTADGARADGARIVASAAFQQGIGRLLALAAGAPTAFMCSEADYHSCHRHHLISPTLMERGVAVWHILPDGSLEAGHIPPRQMHLF